MRRNCVARAFCVGLVVVLTAACGGSKAVTDSDPIVSSGNAILQGTVEGASEGVRVVAIGTPAAADLDDDGVFVLSKLPPGTVNLRFEGAGANATVSVPGLQDGLVATVQLKVSGATAQLTGAVNCAPSADIFFSGLIERMTGTQLVVAGRTVDASQNKKVWRGEKRITLADLQVGEKVKVWGVLRADDVVVSEEIAALTTGPGDASETWTSFSGKVESVSASAHEASDVHAHPGTSYATVVVAGRLVRTNDQTKLTWSDGGKLDAQDIKVGQTARVEGWKKADGSIRATSFQVEGTSPAGSFTSFRGRVESISASALDVTGSPHVTRTFVIAGRKVKTDGSTTTKWSDGSWLDTASVVVGDTASVEGWNKPEGYVLATKLVVDKR
jgi:hypothetical protein